MTEQNGKNAESKTYKQMLDEVETIVKEVGSPELDLDAMVGRVEKGYELIKTMRARLEETKKKVEKLREEHESEE